MKKFSIILPVRNGGFLVKECVNSILAQTNQDFNLIVLDNNSSDGTREWITSLKDHRVILHSSTTSLTIVENWGRIKDVQKNEFITLIGHDDILLPHYLQEMQELILRHPNASLYQSHFSFIDIKGDFVRHCMPMDEMQHGHEFLACQLARTMDSMGTGYMMRSRDFDMLGGMPVNYPNLIFADYQLWVELTMLNYKATSQRTCFNYRLHESVSKMTNGEEYQIAFEKYVYFLAALAQKDEKVASVIDKYGYDMLMYFCESLSHRLLKTPLERRNITVEAFISKCKSYANTLIPAQHFDPSSKFRINIAGKLDNPVGRAVFNVYKKLTS